MAFLANHDSVSEVVGIDGVMKALEEFSKEQPSLEIKKVEDSSGGPVERLAGNGISLLRGDFFDLDEQATSGKFDSIFDRASIVAINPELREKVGKIQKY